MIINRKIKNTIPYIVILILGAALIVRASKGMIWSDEAYYFSTAARFAAGDRPFVDEWYPSQLYSLLLVPFVTLWKAAIGSYDGIYYAARIAYVLLQCGLAACIYRILSRIKGRTAACITAVLFLLYCKNNIITLSYYSVSFACVFMGSLMVYLIVSQRGGWGVSAAAGLFYSLAIISNPYLLIDYLIVLVYMTVRAVRGSGPAVDNKEINKENNKEMNRKKEELLRVAVMFLVSAAAGSITILSVLKNSSLELILNNLGSVTGDENYFGITAIISHMVSAVGGVVSDLRFTLPLYLAMLVFILRRRIRKSLDSRTAEMLRIINSALFIAGLLTGRHSLYLIGNVFTAAALYGLFDHILAEKTDRDWFVVIFLQGVVIAVLNTISSDTGYSAFIHGIVIAGLAVPVMCNISSVLPGDKKDGIRCGKWNKAFLSAILALIGMAVMVVTLCAERLIYVYRDADLWKLDRKIESGPFKGIYTCTALKGRYDAISEAVGMADEKLGEKGQVSDMELCILGFAPWAYLESDAGVGVYTTWRYYDPEDNTTAVEYYRLHPDRIPDAVLLLSENYCESFVDPDTAPQKPIYNEQADNGESSWYDNWMKSSTISGIESCSTQYDVPCGRLYIRNR